MQPYHKREIKRILGEFWCSEYKYVGKGSESRKRWILKKEHAAPAVGPDGVPLIQRMRRDFDPDFD